jgi:putative ABC transport system ATP-binding protein
VEAKGIHKSFGDGATKIEVLRGVDFSVYRSELLLLVGPSGCGKTTLLTVIAGLLSYDTGSVNLLGQDLDKMSASQITNFRAQNIGFIFQQFNLIPTLTITENAAIPLLINKVPHDKALKAASEMLVKVGLDGRQKELPGKLSGGQQQRVAIARALVANPKILICDEPTASLDGETGAKVMDTLRKMALDDGRTVIVVTHDNRIFHYGDRMARMVDGKVTSVAAVRKSQALDVRMLPIHNEGKAAASAPAKAESEIANDGIEESENDA